jgi:EmrB/QacA subfamily drug resistance transporter
VTGVLEASSRPHPRSWRAIALLVAGAFFMENLDGTVIATAVPRMARSFGVPPVDLNVTITAYLLTLGVFIPVSGWVADRFGARTVFATAIGVFTCASGLCAISTGLGELTVMRVLQGIGGAMMVPVGRLVVLRSTTKTELIDAIAYLTWPALAAPVIAPALGGALTTYASWRWIFAVNLPLGVAALLVTLRIVPNARLTEHTRLDWWGFALTGGGLTAFVYGLEVVANANAARGGAVIGLVGGAALLWLSVRHLRRRPHPLLDLSLLKIPTFRVTNLGGSLFRLAIGAAPFLLPLMFQSAFGWSPLKSGLLVIAVFVGNIGVKPLTTPILRRFSFRFVLVGAGVASAAAFALCATFSAQTPLAVIVVVLLASGVFRSIGFTAYNTIVFADLAPAELNDANTLSSTMQQLTMGLGVAIGALALRAGGPLDSVLGVSRNATDDFRMAFILLALVQLLAVVESALLGPHAGAAITEHHRPLRQGGSASTAR